MQYYASERVYAMYYMLQMVQIMSNIHEFEKNDVHLLKVEIYLC